MPTDTQSKVTATRSEVIDPFHPLYLHPSDTPGTLLVTVSFNQTGFGEWKEGMLISLSAKNKIQIIDGTFPEPNSNSQLFRHWERCNNMVKAWILNALSKDIAKTVLYYKTAKEAWNNLVDRYGVANISQYYSIQRAISSTAQGSFDIAHYYTKLKGYWDELHSLSIGNPCTCGAMHESNETHKLLQFLSGLNDSYSTVRSSILMMVLVPSVEKAYSILIRDEKQKEVYSDCPVFSPDSVSCSASSSSNSRIHPSSQSINRSFNQRVNFDSKRNDFVCKYCKKSGHTIDKCFKLHGFPPEFKFTKGKRIATCTQVETPADPTSPLDSSPVDPLPHGFSKEQYDHIMKFFHNVQISTTNPGPSSQAYANFAGPFSEEPTGDW